MFPARIFAPRYFAPRYFPKVGAGSAPVTFRQITLVGHGKQTLRGTGRQTFRGT